jgi:hypothetical protein
VIVGVAVGSGAAVLLNSAGVSTVISAVICASAVTSGVGEMTM